MDGTMVTEHVRPLHDWPLRRIGSAAAAAHARLLTQPLNALRWSFDSRAAHASSWRVQLTVNDTPLHLQVHAVDFDDWTPEVAGPDIPQALASAGVSRTGAPLWQALSTTLNARVRFVHAQVQPSASVPGDAIAWSLPAQGWHGMAWAEDDTAWQGMVASLPARLTASPSEGLMDLPLQLSFGLGFTRLSPNDLPRLRPHCVVLLDEEGAVHRHRELHRLGLTVLAGPNRRLIARAVWVGQSLYRVADAPYKSIDVASSFAGAAMNTPRSSEGASATAGVAAATPAPTKPQAGEPSPAPSTAPARAAPAQRPPTLPAEHRAPDLSEVEVEVRFELGRQRWPLRELVQWRVGQPVPLDLSMVDTPVTAWVHDKCIATGRLVVVGERLGVRLHDVFAPVTAPSTKARAPASAAPRRPRAATSKAASSTPASSTPASSKPAAIDKAAAAQADDEVHFVR
jgi:flagellar motor switch/type III secretory pathway protein FliN